MKKHLLVLAFLILCVGFKASYAQDFSKVEIKVTKVAGSVYMLQGAGGNIGVSVGPDGILIVDDQFAPLAPKIEAALAKLNPGKLRFVLNTHYHGHSRSARAHRQRQRHLFHECERDSFWRHVFLGAISEYRSWRRRRRARL